MQRQLLNKDILKKVFREQTGSLHNKKTASAIWIALKKELIFNGFDLGSFAYF